MFDDYDWHGIFCSGCTSINVQSGYCDDCVKLLRDLVDLIEGAVIDRDWQRIESAVAEYRSVV